MQFLTLYDTNLVERTHSGLSCAGRDRPCAVLSRLVLNRGEIAGNAVCLRSDKHGRSGEKIKKYA